MQETETEGGGVCHKQKKKRVNKNEQSLGISL